MSIELPAHRKIVQAVQGLPTGLQAHIAAVQRTSADLAQRHGLDVATAELAAQAHDICRTLKGPDLVASARRFKLPVSPADLALPIFLHGPVGAEVLRREYGLDDDAILNPIRYHTMGRAGMSGLEKVLFLADKLDPSKIGRYPFITEVAELAKEDLDQAMLLFVDAQAKAFIEQGSFVHPGMMEARNDALLAIKGRERDGAQPGS